MNSDNNWNANPIEHREEEKICLKCRFYCLKRYLCRVSHPICRFMNCRTVIEI